MATHEPFQVIPVSLKLMTVGSPAAANVIHDAYLKFMRAWVRVEPADRRRWIRVSWRVGAIG